jgi:hypothetical protein
MVGSALFDFGLSSKLMESTALSKNLYSSSAMAFRKVLLPGLTA